MPLPYPPTWLKNWRTDPTATILGGVLLSATAIGLIQYRATAQIAQLRADAARERGESARQFEKMQAVLDRLARTTPSGQHSINAAESGRKAIAAGRWGAGQVYLINAITNDPSNVAHLKTYTSAVLAHERPPEEALDQLNSILQMAACHVAPDDVSAVLAQIEQVERTRTKLKAQEPAEPPTAPTTADGIDAEWARLKEVPNNLHADSVRLAGHLRALEEFAGRLDEQDRPAADPLTGLVAAEIRRWTEVAQAARNVAYVDQCLAKLTDDALKQTDNDRAVAIVQAAEAVLPSFWGIPTGTLPGDLQTKIDTYPDSIKKRVDAISLKKSADLMKQIEVALGAQIDIKDIPGTQVRTLGTIEKSCLVTQEQVKRAQVLAAQLPSPDKILAAQKLIEPKTQELQRSRNEQYSRFQAEVIGRCNGAFRNYQTYTLGLAESDALKVFHDNRLEQVDQALLSPEVSRLFNDMLGKLMAEMGPVKLVQTEGEMSSAKKLKLEDF